ncbi:MAG TPA: alpha/beta fold hydrolase [Myxococcales bacterium]|jgi:hypothetical protein
MTSASSPESAARAPSPSSGLARQVRRKATIVVSTVAAAWLLALAALALFQDRVIFPAPGKSQSEFFRGGQILRLPSARGEAVALYFPGRGFVTTLVYFHGNGEQLIDTEDWIFELTRRGFAVLAVEYPGYGLAASSGPPSEPGCYAAAEAALTWLRAQGVPRENTVLVGHALGAAVAAEMALRGHGERLVLLAPMTSTVEALGRMFPYLPVSWFVRDRFDTLEKAPRIAVPTLIVHGKEDEVVPATMGRSIAKAIPGATLVMPPYSRHDMINTRLEPLSRCVAQFVREGACWVEIR